MGGVVTGAASETSLAPRVRGADASGQRSWQLFPRGNYHTKPLPPSYKTCSVSGRAFPSPNPRRLPLHSCFAVLRRRPYNDVSSAALFQLFPSKEANTKREGEKRPSSVRSPVTQQHATRVKARNAKNGDDSAKSDDGHPEKASKKGRTANLLPLFFLSFFLEFSDPFSFSSAVTTGPFLPRGKKNTRWVAPPSSGESE